MRWEGSAPGMMRSRARRSPTSNQEAQGRRGRRRFPGYGRTRSGPLRSLRSSRIRMSEAPAHSTIPAHRVSEWRFRPSTCSARPGRSTWLQRPRLHQRRIRRRTQARGNSRRSIGSPSSASIITWMRTGRYASAARSTYSKHLAPSRPHRRGATKPRRSGCSTRRRRRQRGAVGRAPARTLDAGVLHTGAMCARARRTDVRVDMDGDEARPRCELAGGAWRAAVE